MPVIVRLRGTQELIAGLARMERSIKRGTSDVVGRRLVREGLRLLDRLTPQNANSAARSGSTRRGHLPLRQQWEAIEQISRDTTYVATLRNRATLTREGQAVMASVESGAKPHIIQAKHAKYLFWIAQADQQFFLGRSVGKSKTGSEVVRDTVDRAQGAGGSFLRLVHHPGMKPFHTVALARERLGRLADEVLRTYARQIEADFGHGFKIGIS